MSSLGFRTAKVKIVPTPTITDDQIHLAEKHGCKWNIGQLSKADVSQLKKATRRGDMVKVFAMWPWFSEGTCKKVCWVRMK